MNPIDHSHGGGEGRGPIGRKDPQSLRVILHLHVPSSSYSPSRTHSVARSENHYPQKSQEPTQIRPPFSLALERLSAWRQWASSARRGPKTRPRLALPCSEDPIFMIPKTHVIVSSPLGARQS
ncbi:hypothetical protein F8388_019969 [Cannabis sativa]|uniref:Ribosomal protein L2 n=1 Tax=Cannabis sativa TaxID=3483 RepID=A0A7J6GTS0_CANSA|nr:hypothetical protein F8388_019969 [Cannabis sativa]